MEESLQERIEDLQYQIGNIDGHTILGNIGNRVYGALGLTISALVTYSFPLVAPISVPFAIEMIGDIATGKHHFISYRLLKAHPKYELEKLLAQSHTQSVDTGTLSVPTIQPPATHTHSQTPSP